MVNRSLVVITIFLLPFLLDRWTNRQPKDKHMDGQTDGWTDKQKNGQTDRWMDGQTEGRTVRLMD